MTQKKNIMINSLENNENNLSPVKFINITKITVVKLYKFL